MLVTRKVTSAVSDSFTSTIPAMTTPTGPERDSEQAKQLLEEYSFDLSGFTPGELLAIWQTHLEADPSWIRAAVLEALYQGRYKAYSVEQILRGWKRRGHPIRHFTSEFERVVFGPIDPTASKYAPMAAVPPSQLMAPQPEPSSDRAAAVELPPPAESADGPAPEPTDSTEPPSSPDEGVTNSADAADTADADSHASTEHHSVVPTPTAESVIQSPTMMSSHVFDHPAPIQRFVPQAEASGFYYRLQAVTRPESGG